MSTGFISAEKLLREWSYWDSIFSGVYKPIRFSFPNGVHKSVDEEMSKDLLSLVISISGAKALKGWSEVSNTSIPYLCERYPSTLFLSKSVSSLL